MRPYLEGYHFTVITDHYSLKWLHSLQNPSGRLARWALELQQYDFNIEYRKGSLNIVADALSRAPLPIPEPDSIMTISEVEWCDRMKRLVQENGKKYPDFQIIQDQLFKHIPRKSACDSTPEWKLCVASKDRLQILRENHDSPEAGHFGIYKTAKRIQENYYWPGLYRDVEEYVRSCSMCARYKPEQKKAVGYMNTMQCTRPWEIVAADFVGPLPRSTNGHTSLLVMIDIFSKWVELIPTRQALAKDVVKALRERIIFRFGCPRIFLSDNGVHFMSKMVRDFLNDSGIQHRTTAPYSPHENPTERMNRTVKTMIGQQSGSDHRHWDQRLPEIAFAINTAISETSRLTPAEIIYGKNPICPNQFRQNFKCPSETVCKKEIEETWEVIERRKKDGASRQAKYYNLRRRQWKPTVGEKVWKRERQLSSAVDKFAQKLAEKFSGPFKVVRCLAANIYELHDEDNRKIRCNIQDMKPFNERS